MSKAHNAAPRLASVFAPPLREIDRLAALASNLSYISTVPHRETPAQQVADAADICRLYRLHTDTLRTLVNKVVICHLPNAQLNMHHENAELQVRVLSKLHAQDALYRFDVTGYGEPWFEATQHAYLNCGKAVERTQEEVQLWRGAGVLRLVQEAAELIGHPGYQSGMTE